MTKRVDDMTESEKQMVQSLGPGWLEVKRTREAQDRRTAELATEVEVLRGELRWYGHTIAGGGPVVGYAKCAREAENRWYEYTLPLLAKQALPKAIAALRGTESNGEPPADNGGR